MAEKDEYNWEKYGEDAWNAVLEGVKRLRNEKNLSLRKIGEMLDIKSPAHIAEWLKGDRTAPNSPFPKMLRYLYVLGYNPINFVPDTKKPNKDNKQCKDEKNNSSQHDSPKNKDSRAEKISDHKYVRLNRAIEILKKTIQKQNNKITEIECELSFYSIENKTLLDEIHRLNNIIIGFDEEKALTEEELDQLSQAPPMFYEGKEDDPRDLDNPPNIPDFMD